MDSTHQTSTTSLIMMKKALFDLQTKLVEDEAGPILAYLPDLSAYRFKQSLRGGAALQIHLGVHAQAPTYATPEGRSFYKDVKSRVHPVTDSTPWANTLSPPGVFGWVSRLRDGLRQPMEAQSLALLQYICLLHVVKDELDITVPVPAYDDLMAGLDTLSRTKKYLSYIQSTPGKTFKVHIDEVPADDDLDEGAPSSDNSLFSGLGPEYDTFSEVSSYLRTLRNPVSEESSKLQMRVPSRDRSARRATKEPSGSGENIHKAVDGSVPSDRVRCNTNTAHKRNQSTPMARVPRINESTTPRQRPRRTEEATDSPTHEQTAAFNIDFDNIIVPKRDVTGRGPVRRSHFRATSPPAPPGLDAEMRALLADPEHGDMPETMEPDVNSADPGVLARLRRMIPQYLLAKLPEVHSLKFTEHTKSIKYARLRVLLGVCNEKDPTLWGEKVWAYLLPNRNSRRGPILQIETDRRVKDNRHEVVQLTWDDDISVHRVDLQPVFKEASNRAQLYAIIKYYFLLATEAKLEGYEHDFIPFNETFVQELQAVCEKWGSKLTNSEGSVMIYEDVDKTPPPRTKTPAQRSMSASKNKLGVAQKIANPTLKDEHMSDFVEEDDVDGAAHRESRGGYRKADAKGKGKAIQQPTSIVDVSAQQPSPDEQRERSPSTPFVPDVSTARPLAADDRPDVLMDEKWFDEVASDRFRSQYRWSQDSQNKRGSDSYQVDSDSARTAFSMTSLALRAEQKRRERREEKSTGGKSGGKPSNPSGSASPSVTGGKKPNPLAHRRPPTKAGSDSDNESLSVIFRQQRVIGAWIDKTLRLHHEHGRAMAAHGHKMAEKNEELEGLQRKRDTLQAKAEEMERKRKEREEREERKRKEGKETLDQE